MCQFALYCTVSVSLCSLTQRERDDILMKQALLDAHNEMVEGLFGK